MNNELLIQDGQLQENNELNYLDDNYKAQIGQISYLYNSNNTALNSFYNIKNTYNNYNLSSMDEETLKMVFTNQLMQAGKSEEEITATITQLITVKRMYEGNKDLIEQMIQLLEGNNQALKGLINTFNQTSGQLKDGSNQLLEGTNTLNNGLLKIKEGTTNLSEGSNTLNDATKTLSDGITKLNSEGINKLSNYGNKAINYKNKINNLVSLSNNYKGFASNNSDTTIFIYKLSTK